MVFEVEIIDDLEIDSSKSSLHMVENTLRSVTDVYTGSSSLCIINLAPFEGPFQGLPTTPNFYSPLSQKFVAFISAANKRALSRLSNR